MDTPKLSRRALLMQGSTALTGLALLHSPLLVHAFPSRPGEEVIPWVDQPLLMLKSSRVDKIPR